MGIITIRMPKYIHRSLETLLADTVKQFSVVIITGARQCGKSTMVQELFPKFKYILLDEFDALSYAKDDPRGFLKDYSAPVILDEIQECPELLSYVKGVIDGNKQKPGQYIITGSQQFNLMEGVKESLAGRAAILDLAPFTLKELNKQYKQEKDWSFWVSKGFYPQLWTEQIKDRELWYSSYIRTVIEKDIKEHISSENLLLFERFINTLMGRVSQIINYADIAKDIGVSYKTIQTWTKLLERSNIIFLLSPYLKDFGKRITKSPKLYFYDTGLVAHYLGFTTDLQIKRGPLSGALFENLVISEIKKTIMSKSHKPKLYFFRESNGLEVDLLLEDKQELTAIEIKSNSTPTLQHAKNLESFSKIAKGVKKSILLSPREEPTTRKGVEFRYYKDFAESL